MNNYNNRFERKPVNYSQPQKPVEIPDEEFELPGDPVEENLDVISEEIQEKEGDALDAKDATEDQEQLDAKEFPIKVKIVGCVSLNLRSTPDKSDSSNIISVLKKENRINVHRFEGDWAYVATNFGMEGYVLRSFIEEV